MTTKEKIVYLPVDSLVPYENNARENDAAVPFLANSIRDHGFRNPILVDKDHVIIAGHTRLKAAKELGLTEVPCIVITDLPPEKVASLRLADNKVSDYSGWDWEKLDLELKGLDDIIDMSAYGFDMPENLDLSDLAQPEEPEPAREEPLGGFEPLALDDKYRVIVTVDSEEEADDLVQFLEDQGYSCKTI